MRPVYAPGVFLYIEISVKHLNKNPLTCYNFIQ